MIFLIFLFNLFQVINFRFLKKKKKNFEQFLILIFSREIVSNSVYTFRSFMVNNLIVKSFVIQLIRLYFLYKCLPFKPILSLSNHQIINIKQK